MFPVFIWHRILCMHIKRSCGSVWQTTGFSTHKGIMRSVLKPEIKARIYFTWYFFQNSFARAYGLIFKSISTSFYEHTWISNYTSQPRQKFQTKILMCDNRWMHNLNFEWLCLSTGISLKKKWQDEKNKLKKVIL